MNQNIKINPVKATCMKNNCDSLNLQSINDDCFGICTAFSGSPDPYTADKTCQKSCVDLVEQRKKHIFGVGSCDHQFPYLPVYWNQVPRYVPALLKNGMKVEQARERCKNLCEKIQLKSECQEKCDLDANAVEEYTPESAEKSVEELMTEPKDTSVPNLAIIIPVSLAVIMFIIILIYSRM
jgi:hypothetical protein